MTKLILQNNQKEDFLKYAYNRMNRSSHIKNYDHVTASILEKTFDFFVRHKLTVENNGKIYWYRNGKKQIESDVYSKRYKDDMEIMIDNLFHEVFCQAEWLARGLRDGYSDVCKTYFGKDYNKITAGVV